jgi:hypothetical protein
VSGIVFAALGSPSSAPAHGWYHGLRSPRGIECCDNRDCRPVPYRQNASSGREEIEVEGRWWPIEYENVLALPTPDGEAHACWSSLGYRLQFRCIILPGMARLDGSGPVLTGGPNTIPGIPRP